MNGDPQNDDLAALLTGFANLLRQAGMRFGPDRVVVAAGTLAQLRPLREREMYWATRLAFCLRREDLDVFDAVFGATFAVPVPEAADRPWTEDDAIARAAPRAALSGDPTGPPTTQSGIEAGREVGLARRDIRTLDPRQRAEINRLIAALVPRGGTRRSLRYLPGGRAQVDAPRTFRVMVRSLGEPAALLYRHRIRLPRRLVLLLDVSGSMRGYQDALLHFAHAAVRAGSATTEVFLLDTWWIPVTGALRSRDPQTAVDAVAEAKPGWDGGTRLGPTLGDFLRVWSGRRALRSAVAVVASDGWDDSEDEDAALVRHVGRLSRIAYRLIWADPYARAGEPPDAPALERVMRFVHAHVAGGSYDDLRSLAELIAHA